MLWQKSLIAPTSDLISNLSVIAHRTQTVTLYAHCDHYLEITGDRVLTGQSMDIVVANSWGDILPKNLLGTLERGNQTWKMAKDTNLMNFGQKWVKMTQNFWFSCHQKSHLSFILNLAKKAHFLISPVSICQTIYPWVMLTACQCTLLVLSPALAGLWSRSYLSNCQHLTSSCFRFNDALPVVRSPCVQYNYAASKWRMIKVTGKPDYWVMMWSERPGHLERGRRSRPLIGREWSRDLNTDLWLAAEERRERWEPGILMRRQDVKSAILNTLVQQTASFLSAFRIVSILYCVSRIPRSISYTMKEYLILNWCLAHLVCWSGPNLMKPISIRTIPFPETSDILRPRALLSVQGQILFRIMKLPLILDTG